jgi:hypothetical protein
MKLAIFYHISQLAFGAFMYQSQVHRLYTSGLIQNANHIHFGLNGDKELFNVPENATVKINTNWKEETETLISLRDFCKENTDYKVLYFHMKGLTHQSMNGESWRLMMEHFVIDKWKECVEKLDEYDAVGSNLKILGPTTWSDGRQSWEKAGTKHFVGNFWWANASYINQLDNSFLTSDFRLDREFWIGTGNGNMKSLYQPDDYEPYQYFYREVDYVTV